MKIPKFIADKIRAIAQDALQEALEALKREILDLIDQKLKGSGV